jgi:plasmid stability protein
MKSIQMTIRKIPDRVDQRLRDRAKREGKSLNRIAIEALERGLGLSSEVIEYHDLDDLAGTWIEDAEFDKALEEMHRVDPELWK